MKKGFFTVCGFAALFSSAVYADAVRDDMVNGCIAGRYIVNSAVGLASQGYSQQSTINIISDDLVGAGWIMTSSAQQLVAANTVLGFQMYGQGRSSVDAAEAFFQHCMSTIPN